MVMEWWVFCFDFIGSRVVLIGVRTHVVAITVCATEGVHTLACCTRIYLVYMHCAYTSHILMRVTYMHGSRVSAVGMSSSLCHLTFSLLMFHPSLLLLFLDGHFETFPDFDDLTDVSVHAILPNFPDLKAQVKRTPHEDEESGYLADSARSTGYEPKESDKIPSVDNDTTHIDDPDLNEISDFSKTTNENTCLFGVHTVFESSFLNVSHWWFCSSERKAKKACNRETVAGQSEREEREGFVISVAQSMSKKSRRNNMRSHSLQTLRKFFSDGWDLRGHLEWRAQQAILGENSDQREFFSTEYNMEIQNLERRNSEYSLFWVSASA